VVRKRPGEVGAGYCRCNHHLLLPGSPLTSPPASGSGGKPGRRWCPLPVARRASCPGPAITPIAIPIVPGGSDVSVFGHRQGNARIAASSETSVTIPIVARRSQVAVRRYVERVARVAVLPETVTTPPVGPRAG
jgi:hypothetical protein